MAQSKELLIPVDEEYAIKTLKDEDAVKTLLESIKILATETVFDMTTKAGQKECASMAAKVSKCKTTIDGFGKDYVGEIKATVKDIDANRKLLRDSLDYLKQEVRQPLNELENAEKERQAKHEAVVEKIKEIGLGQYSSSAGIHGAINLVDEIDISNLEEFKPEAEQAKAGTMTMLQEKLADMAKREEEQAELERLREETRKKDAELQAQQAAEQARIAAQRESEARVAQAEEAARQSEIKAQAAEKAAQAKLQAQADAEEQEKAAREADVAHRQNINRQVLEDLLSIPTINEDQAKEIIRAIVKGDVRHTTINY